MPATAFLPHTLAERMQMPEQVRIPITWEEFLATVADYPYRVEYVEHEMISIMGYASHQHEEIIMLLSLALMNTLGTDDYHFLGSNLALAATPNDKQYFNPDLTIVAGELKTNRIAGNIEVVTNPLLLVEVISPSTRAYDLSTKYSAYRELPSLKQLLFVDSTAIAIDSYSRLPNSRGWLLQEYRQVTDVVDVLGQGDFSLDAVYRKIKFDS